MPDPHNLLEGTGKNLRHIKIYQITQDNRQTLNNYVRTSTNLAITNPELPIRVTQLKFTTIATWYVRCIGVAIIESRSMTP